jgi:Rrf2 family nitric oxide-sensitive transcriptional repressor
MQLNLFTDYALRVLVHTAARPDRRGTSAQVAEDFGISRHHVVKVVNELQHLGYLETVRGRTGGFTLARPPEDIRLGEVVRQTEGSFRLVECFEPATSTCPLTPACGLRSALGEAMDAFFAVLDRYSLADLVARPQWVRRLITLTPLKAASPSRTGVSRR